MTMPDPLNQVFRFARDRVLSVGRRPAQDSRGQIAKRLILVALGAHAALGVLFGSSWTRSFEIARVLICETRLSLMCISTATSRLCQPKS